MNAKNLREVVVSSEPQSIHGDMAKYFPRKLEPGSLVLDIGGFKLPDSALKSVLPESSNVIAINKMPVPHGRAVDLVSGDKLPFADDQFPLVTSSAIIETAEASKREELIQEMTRVASDAVVFSVPVDSHQNVLFDYELLNEMQTHDLKPKQGIVEQRMRSVPSLYELVKIGRRLRQPFKLEPSINTSTLFQSMLDQVAVLSNDSYPKGQEIAGIIAANAERILSKATQPNWQDAYRAIMKIYKKRDGNIEDDEGKMFLTNNERMAYEAALRGAHFGIDLTDVVAEYKNNPLRGRHIVIEGPEGSGKTTIVNRVVQSLAKDMGYYVAKQTDHGLRQRIREMEKQMNRVIMDPERAEFFAFAMLEAAVGGNAYTLKGPCRMTVSDRGLESVRMHHGLHCPTNDTIPFLLAHDAIKNPPDLTIVLKVPDPNQNYYLMQKDGDLVNRTKGIDALNFQRNFYNDLIYRGGSEFTGPIVGIVNPGTEGSMDDVYRQVMETIEYICEVPTTRGMKKA